VACFNFASAFGRLGFGYLGDLIGPLNALFAGLVLNAVSLLVIWPVSTSLAPLVVFCVVSGSANGSFFSAMPSVIGGIFGAHLVSTAMGMIVTGWTAVRSLARAADPFLKRRQGYLSGGPIAGYLLEAFGGQGAGLSAFRCAQSRESVCVGIEAWPGRRCTSPARSPSRARA
jgi:MFS family permease